MSSWNSLELLFLRASTQSFAHDALLLHSSSVVSMRILSHGCFPGYSLFRTPRHCHQRGVVFVRLLLPPLRVHSQRGV